MYLKIIVALVGAVFASVGPFSDANADTYPARPIRIVSPAPPGGMSDIYSRLIAARFARLWSQPAVVENKSGTGGYLGADFVARSSPDGYTLLMGTITTNALTSFLFETPSYNTATDFVPVALVAEAEGVAVVHPSLPIKTIPELISFARANSASFSVAAGGRGTAGHLAAELFKTMSGLEQLEIVQYRGMAPMVTDLVAGHVSFGFPTMQTVVEYVRSGRLRGLAVMGDTHSVALPDLPTVSEAGLKGFAVSNWIGLFAPAGTPPEIVNRLNAEVTALMETPEMQARLLVDGGRFRRNSPEEFKAFVLSETAKWGPIVKASGLKPQ